MSTDFQDSVHSVCCELAGMAEAINGMSLCRDTLPLEWLQQWAARLHSELDRAFLDLRQEQVMA